MTEKVLKAFASAFKIPNADEFIATLKNGDEWLSDDEIAQVVEATISEKVTAAKKASRSAGQGEQNAKLAKIVKAAGFDNSENLMGDELLSAFVTWKDEQATPPPDSAGDVSKLSVDDVLKLPVGKEIELKVRQQIGQNVDDLTAQLKAKDAEFEKFKSGVNQSRAEDALARFIPEVMRKAGVILKVEGIENSEDARIKSFTDLIKHTRKFTLGSDGSPVFVDENGEPIKDEYGNAVSAQDVIVSIAKPMYGIAKQDPNNGGGNPPLNGGQGGQQAPPKMFATQDEYNKYMMTETDGTKKLAAVQSWQYHEKQAAGN